MAGILDTFLILFESDSSKLDKGFEATTKKAEGLAKKIGLLDKDSELLGQGFLKLAGQAAAAIGVVVALSAIASSVSKTAAETHELKLLAEQLGTTADAVDEFTDAATLIGISADVSKEGLISMSRAVNDTVMGMGRAKKVFEEIGVSAVDAMGKARPVMEVMAQLSGKMANMDRGQKIRIMERLGLNPSMLRLFNADMDNLRARMEQIDRGTKYSLADAVNRSEEYTKASKAMGVELHSLKMYADKFIESLDVAAMPLFTKGMETAAATLNKIFNFLTEHSDLVTGALIAIGGAVAYFVTPALFAAAAAAWAMIVPFLPIIAAVVGLGAAFALLYEDVMAFVEGNDSMIGQILESFPIIGQIVESVANSFKTLWNAAKLMFNIVVTSGEIAINILKIFGLWASKAFSDFVSGSEEIQIAIKLLGDGFALMGEGVVAVWDWIMGKIESAIALFSKAAGFVKGLIGDTTTGFGNSNSLLMKDANRHIGAAMSAPLSSSTSSSISNSSAKSNNVTIGEVKVQTQATDAAGISKALGGALGNQMRQAVNGMDDGVLA
jgi:hypothetical protein